MQAALEWNRKKQQEAQRRAQLGPQRVTKAGSSPRCTAGLQPQQQRRSSSSKQQPKPQQHAAQQPCSVQELILTLERIKQAVLLGEAGARTALLDLLGLALDLVKFSKDAATRGLLEDLVKALWAAHVEMATYMEANGIPKPPLFLEGYHVLAGLRTGKALTNLEVEKLAAIPLITLLHVGCHKTADGAIPTTDEPNRAFSQRNDSRGSRYFPDLPADARIVATFVHVAGMAEEDYMLAKQLLGDIIPGNSQDHNLPKMPKGVQIELAAIMLRHLKKAGAEVLAVMSKAAFNAIEAALLDTKHHTPHTEIVIKQGCGVTAMSVKNAKVGDVTVDKLDVLGGPHPSERGGHHGQARVVSLDLMCLIRREITGNPDPTLYTKFLADLEAGLRSCKAMLQWTAAGSSAAPAAPPRRRSAAADPQAADEQHFNQLIRVLWAQLQQLKNPADASAQLEEAVAALGSDQQAEGGAAAAAEDDSAPVAAAGDDSAAAAAAAEDGSKAAVDQASWALLQLMMESGVDLTVNFADDDDPLVSASALVEFLSDGEVTSTVLGADVWVDILETITTHGKGSKIAQDKVEEAINHTRQQQDQLGDALRKTELEQALLDYTVGLIKMNLQLHLAGRGLADSVDDWAESYNTLLKLVNKALSTNLLPKNISTELQLEEFHLFFLVKRNRMFNGSLQGLERVAMALDFLKQKRPKIYTDLREQGERVFDIVLDSLDTRLIYVHTLPNKNSHGCMRRFVVNAIKCHYKFFGKQPPPETKNPGDYQRKVVQERRAAGQLPEGLREVRESRLTTDKQVAGITHTAIDSARRNIGSWSNPILTNQRGPDGERIRLPSENCRNALKVGFNQRVLDKLPAPQRDLLEEPLPKLLVPFTVTFTGARSHESDTIAECIAVTLCFLEHIQELEELVPQLADAWAGRLATLLSQQPLTQDTLRGVSRLLQKAQNPAAEKPEKGKPGLGDTVEQWEQHLQKGGGPVQVAQSFMQSWQREVLKALQVAKRKRAALYASRAAAAAAADSGGSSGPGSLQGGAAAAAAAAANSNGSSGPGSSDGAAAAAAAAAADSDDSSGPSTSEGGTAAAAAAAAAAADSNGSSGPGSSEVEQEQPEEQPSRARKRSSPSTGPNSSSAQPSSKRRRGTPGASRAVPAPADSDDNRELQYAPEQSLHTAGVERQSMAHWDPAHMQWAIDDSLRLADEMQQLRQAAGAAAAAGGTGSGRGEVAGRGMGRGRGRQQGDAAQQQPVVDVIDISDSD